MSAPRVSIVVPSFQQARYLPLTLKSLAEQRGLNANDLEILVIDGGSSDGSVDVIRRFESRLAYWTSEADRGQTHALRKGFDLASGDIQGWLCSDDVLEPYAIREVIDFFDRKPAARFCYGDALWIDAQGKTIRRKKSLPFNWFIWKHDHNYIQQPSAFWRRDLYLEAGGLDETFDLAMDADLFARFAELSWPVHVGRTWSRARWYPEQKTQQQRSRSLGEFREVCRRHGASVDNPLTRAAASTLAKALRVAWKLAAGCYLP